VAELVHEIWEEVNDGMVLHTCCLAGKRDALEEFARVIGRRINFKDAARQNVFER